MPSTSFSRSFPAHFFPPQSASAPAYRPRWDWGTPQHLPPPPDLGQALRDKHCPAVRRPGEAAQGGGRGPPRRVAGRPSGPGGDGRAAGVCLDPHSPRPNPPGPINCHVNPISNDHHHPGDHPTPFWSLTGGQRSDDRRGDATPKLKMEFTSHTCAHTPAHGWNGIHTWFSRVMGKAPQEIQCCCLLGGGAGLLESEPQFSDLEF